MTFSFRRIPFAKSAGEMAEVVEAMAFKFGQPASTRR